MAAKTGASESTSHSKMPRDRKAAANQPTNPFLKSRLPLVYEDLSSTYARNLHKWLVVAPLVGVTVGLTMTALAVLVLRELWPPVLAYYLGHHWAIVPGLVVGCA